VQAQEVREVSGRSERVGDHQVALEVERGAQLAVLLGEQRLAVDRPRAVERGEPGERRVVVRVGATDGDVSRGSVREAGHGWVLSADCGACSTDTVAET